MAREFGTCKGCGAEIEWARLNGRPHPFDVTPTDKGRGYELVEPATEPSMVAVYVDAGMMQARRLNGEKPRLVVSHFSTCPQASSFRKGK